ncbi:MAG TPA: TetR/AcrR family transcriptional regulator [Moraxellaceae bacterium]|nr:TetR/AcrR family transcriptional regulator [Moraxellaceae bacterium]
MDSSSPSSPGESRQARQRVVPVQARSRARIDAILDAAASLLAAEGVEAATTAAIARVARTTPATVYHYFENRLAVFAALARRTMANVDAALTERLAALAVADELHTGNVLASLYEAYRDAPGYVAVLRVLRAEPTLYELVQESNQRMARVIAGVLDQRTRLAPDRALRVALILSDVCEQVVQMALMATASEAAALIAEMTEMLDVLLVHYAAPGGPVSPRRSPG